MFEFLDRDLKRYMDLVVPNEIDPNLVKVRRFCARACPHNIIIYA